MTSSWAVNCFIIGSIILLVYPAITFIYRETKSKGKKR